MPLCLRVSLGLGAEEPVILTGPFLIAHGHSHLVNDFPRYYLKRKVFTH